MQKKKDEEVKKINALASNVYFDSHYNPLDFDFSYSIENNYIAKTAKEITETLTKI